jgi:DNA-binding transcriptional regulator YdaS (Cro superfamily)
MHSLKTYVTAERGRIARLAADINAQEQLVGQWANQRRQVPADRCHAIERATRGAVTCEQLRPDVPWLRVADSRWRWHKRGRPVLDITKTTS